MIARPYASTFGSFLAFLFICFGLLVVNSLVVFKDPEPQWFNYLIIVVLAPITVFVTYRVVSRYKTVNMGNSQIEVHYPLFRIHRKYLLTEVASWAESTVQTGKTSKYKELEVLFTDGRKIQMGYREFTEYDSMLRYLTQKLPKAKITQ